MKPALVDTDILSMFFRNDAHAVSHFKKYLTKYDKINISIITYYEILSGLKHKDAARQINVFLEFAKNNTLLFLTENSVSTSANLYAALRKKGKPLDDIDLLIAGIALSSNLALATHNVSDFKRIEELDVEDWGSTG